MEPSQPHISDLDVVEEASRESFPASDAPAWSSAHAAPSPESIAEAERERALERDQRTRLRRIAIAFGALGALVGLALTWRFVARSR